MPLPLSRRALLALAGGVAAAPALARAASSQGATPSFDISLAQWSLHRTLRSGKLDPLDFPRAARRTYEIGAVEYVNTFFKEKAGDFDYLRDLKRRADDSDVRSLLIMIDGEGDLANPDKEARRKAIENHFRWLAAAAFLGCHSIRVNAAGDGPREEQKKRAAESLARLAEVATPYGLNVIVENHGGYSSDGSWLAAVMRAADHPRVGTLPDFGNFHLGGGEWYDRYQGVTELMPFAKAVSAKSHEFDDAGNEVRTDYRKMMRIVLAAGYRGFVGIEYEGDQLPEEEGILATKQLLETVRTELAAE